MSVRQAKTSSRCRARALLRQTTQRTNSTGIKLQQNSSDRQSFNAAVSPMMVHVLKTSLILICTADKVWCFLESPDYF